ncbi:GntR family transcriptional regulator [Enterovirga rhinocerotis]|uniref:DNA-binding GntR family transcriptional regulator n=1 Tax=Enterovirga rhinocerotis TaxID=1339210 RepID=A0A4R7BYV9_9HYPH|nr:GntR family transcriptional regulator [Enterovirga rhinocerotis]TDR89945.1 DNA-binding GntR family transcriptional regulator [Enterovirga rhinocerotis]
MQPLPSAPILVDQVYRRLMTAIADRTLPPGRRIRQGELAESLGVSRQPISHALQLLKHQGLVRESGRQGLEVAPMDPDRIRHLYRVRSALDELSARDAAERVAAGDSTASERADLAAIVAKGSAFDPDIPLPVLVQADVDFHQRLYAMSSNPVVIEILDPQWPHLRRSMLTVLEGGSYRRRAWEEHAEIARLVLAGDAEAASRASRRHAEIAGEETALRLKGEAATD